MSQACAEKVKIITQSALKEREEETKRAKSAEEENCKLLKELEKLRDCQLTEIVNATAEVKLSLSLPNITLHV